MFATSEFYLTLEYYAAEGDEHGLEYTIVRAFNWVGPRMDFIPGVDGPCNGVPTVLTSFSNVIQACSILLFCYCICTFVAEILFSDDL